MKDRKFKVLAILAMAVTLVMVIRAVNPASASLSVPDPCGGAQSVKASQPISVASASTTAIVASATGQGIYVCGQLINVQTLSDTVKWEYGTQSSTPCDTGTTAITGVIATPASSPSLPYIDIFTPTTQFAVPAGNQLCLVVTGSSPSITGWISYVQG